MGELENNLLDLNHWKSIIRNNAGFIESTSVHDAYILSMDALQSMGEYNNRNSRRTRQLNNMIIEILPSRSKDHHMGYVNKHIYCKTANISPDKQKAVFAWNMTFSNDANLITFYDENYLLKTTDGSIIDSGYGFKWKYQIPGIVKRLIFDRDSNDATLSMFSLDNANNSVSVELDRGISINFKIESDSFEFDRLYMTVIMSKTECYDDLPYDLFNFASLHALVRNELSLHYENLLLGSYTHIINDLYIIEENEEMFDFQLMDIDEIYKKSFQPTFENHITFLNFWFYMPDNIFKKLDKDKFIKYVNNYKQIVSFALTHIFVDEMWLENRTDITNDFSIEEIMPIFNRVKDKANEMGIELPYMNERTETEHFEYLYDCQRAVGRTILGTTFLTCAILNGSVENFKFNHEMILTHSSLKFPVTKYCAYMSII